MKPNGMTLRDWFAGQAIAGRSADDTPMHDCGVYAYTIADLVMQERERLLREEAAAKQADEVAKWEEFKRIHSKRAVILFQLHAEWGARWGRKNCPVRISSIMQESGKRIWMASCGGQFRYCPDMKGALSAIRSAVSTEQERYMWTHESSAVRDGVFEKEEARISDRDWARIEELDAWALNRGAYISTDGGGWMATVDGVTKTRDTLWAVLDLLHRTADHIKADEAEKATEGSAQ